MNAPIRQRDWLFVTALELGVHRTPSLREILDVVSEYYRVSAIEICSARRDKRYMTARHVFVYLARTMTTKSCTTIGRFMSRDHSTVVCAGRKIERLLETDAALRASVNEIKLKLGAA